MTGICLYGHKKICNLLRDRYRKRTVAINERTHIIKHDNDCKVKNENEKIGSIGNPTNNNDFVCSNVLTFSIQW